MNRTQLVMNYVSIYPKTSGKGSMPGWGLGPLCIPKSKDGQRRTRGSWETSEEGQGKDMAGWGGGCGHGEILEVRLVSVVKAGSWAVGGEGTGTPGFLPLLLGCTYVWGAGWYGKMSLFPWMCKLREAGRALTLHVSPIALMPRGFQKTCSWLK